MSDVGTPGTSDVRDPLGHWSAGIDDPHFIKIVMDCWDIYKKKGVDYTQGEWEKDRLANFRKAADDAGTTMLQSWSVLFSKHLHAIQSYVKRGRVESEPIHGRIHDAINYLILLMIMVSEKTALSGEVDQVNYEDPRIPPYIPQIPGHPPRY
jgi:hypothetical protein